MRHQTKKLRDKTLKLIETAHAILASDPPMTVRQVYYRLVASQVIENNPNQYQRIIYTLIQAREKGLIPWRLIEDRSRRLRDHYGSTDAAFWTHHVLRHLTRYDRHPWQGQSRLVELWLEKEALSGILDRYASQYYLTLNVGRGFDSVTTVHDAAERYKYREEVLILYFGDFDPSGEEMVTSLKERLARYGAPHAQILKVALTREDIDIYNLPHDFTKATDTRSKAFIAKHGDIAVELDALPPAVLRERVESSIREHIDLEVFEESQRIEARELEALARILASLKKSADRLIKKEGL